MKRSNTHWKKTIDQYLQVSTTKYFGQILQRFMILISNVCFKIFNKSPNILFHPIIFHFGFTGLKGIANSMLSTIYYIILNFQSAFMQLP